MGEDPIKIYSRLFLEGMSNYTETYQKHSFMVNSQVRYCHSMTLLITNILGLTIGKPWPSISTFHQHIPEVSSTSRHDVTCGVTRHETKSFSSKYTSSNRNSFFLWSHSLSRPMLTINWLTTDCVNRCHNIKINNLNCLHIVSYLTKDNTNAHPAIHPHIKGECFSSKCQKIKPVHGLIIQ